ncbi:unnamed protein product [Polarella glacialis]|uniref:B30.2/SPRY domain-containing protein n=2 Tax=Polarella glacialis TaxID=89957 RepID=A0A813GES0_POLGL|nr:unnamed protein product [Polarella glacialis]
MGKGGGGKGGSDSYPARGHEFKGEGKGSGGGTYGSGCGKGDSGGGKNNTGKNSGKKGGEDNYEGGNGGSSTPATASFATELGTGICLNPADRDESFVFLGRPLLRARRNASHAKWSGCRATKGIAAGRGAFAVKNETGGNMRIGWSLGDATTELGLDDKSFGYGGTAMKSHAGKYSKFGQTYGQDDVVVALIDLERHAISYVKNGHAIPGDAFSIPRHMWGLPFFPHLLTKDREATVTVFFGGPSPPLQVPELPAGFSWMSDLQLVPSARQCDHAGVTVEDAGAVIQVDASQLQQSAHRDQFEDWKIKVSAYANHFQPSLAWEYQAEKESVMHRVKRSIKQLESTGHGCGGLSVEVDSQRLTLTRPQGIPRLSEISIGRTVLITAEPSIVDINDPSTTISGEVQNISERAIILTTTYDKLPDGKGLFRVDLGPNMSTYERVDRVLDKLQSCDKPSKKLQNKMGIVSPCTPLADAIFMDVAETSGAARLWDPSTRPRPNPSSDISVAARQVHYAVPPRVPSWESPPKARQLNESQRLALDLVLKEQRKLSLVQGPPGTGKTTTALEIISGLLHAGRGPILATAFSNKGVNNLAEGLHKSGINVLRVGICDSELPYSMEAHLEYYGYQGRKGAGKGAQNDVIGKADVVCATVVGSGMSLLRNFDFPFVIVDEAAQIIEPALLIPLSKGSVQVVMVGDQCQLPATVLSHQAQQAGLDVSLFDRLISMGMEVHMLSVQYRMHPLIAEFPSWRFYNHKLETGIRPSDRPVLPLQGLDLGTLAIIHVGAAETSQGMSKSNKAEADCVAHLLRALKPGVPLGEVGVITPYSAQVACIRQAIRGVGSEADQVQVSSVDAFQGSEKEAILLSMARSNLRGDIGFVADWRRLNVAATRAKRLLVVVGNLLTLSQHALWRDFLGFHEDLKVLEWTGSGLGALSAEPLQLLRAARQIAKRRGVKPLPLRGDYPVDADFERAERGDLTWDAPPLVEGAEEGLSWDTPAPPAKAPDDWGDAPLAAAADWEGGATAAHQVFQGEARVGLAVGKDGVQLDLAPTRWGMRIEGVDRRSPNQFEVGSTIVAIGGQVLTQADNSEASLDKVEEIFGAHFQDAVEIHLAPQEERLVRWAQVPKDALGDQFDLISEFCPQGMMLYGPQIALDFASNV